MTAKRSLVAVYLCCLIIISSTERRATTTTYAFSASTSPPPTKQIPSPIPPNLLGPPEPLKGLEVGQSVNAFRSVVVTSSNHDNNNNADGQHQEEEQRIGFTIERVANTPNIYVLRNFVTPFECEQIQTLAKERGMKTAETITKNDTKSRKNCSVAWLPSSGPDSSSIVSGLVASTANIFLSNSVKSHPTAGVEDLQVLKYDIGGEFVHHHDGDCRI